MECFGQSCVYNIYATLPVTNPLFSGLLFWDCKQQNARKSNRVKRGLYRDGSYYWNADCVGAFNILRLYFQEGEIDEKLDAEKIQNPEIKKVAV